MPPQLLFLTDDEILLYIYIYIFLLKMEIIHKNGVVPDIVGGSISREKMKIAVSARLRHCWK